MITANESVYVAGPMRGCAEFNFPSFHRAQRLLEQRIGCQVINPALLDETEGFDRRGMTGHEELPADRLHRWMRRNIRLLVGSDHIVLLPDWQHSVGASLEQKVAEACGLGQWEIDLETGDIRPLAAAHFDETVNNATVSPTSALDDAKKAITGPRNDTYGDANLDLGGTATMWSAYLRRLSPDAPPLTAVDVCAMMVLLKVSRAAHSPQHSDHWVDIAGYASLARWIAMGRQ